MSQCFCSTQTAISARNVSRFAFARDGRGIKATAASTTNTVDKKALFYRVEAVRKALAYCFCIAIIGGGEVSFRVWFGVKDVMACFRCDFGGSREVG